jgi:hypothetical protein
MPSSATLITASPPAWGGVFGRVVQQVSQGLGQAGRVADHPHRLGRQVQLQPVAGRVERGLAAFDGDLHHRAQVDELALQHHLAGGDARHVEQLVDQLHEL